MAVSSEFAKTVQENNVLRIRIMLKDSLLVDKSFSMFSELLTYALAHGVEVWMTPEDPLEQAEKPWTLDLMNYELTALVNDFTKEHVNYVKQIIREIYKGEVPVRTPAPSPKPVPRPTQTISRPMSTSGMGSAPKTNDSSYDTILREIAKINRILKMNKDVDGNRRWLTEDIEKIRKSARDIETACENIQRRK